MKFAVITHIAHKKKDKFFYSYEPYVREMNLWFKYVDEVKVLGSFTNDTIEEVEDHYQHTDLVFEEISSINTVSLKNTIIAILKIPVICYRIFNTMRWADHIHLRCPSNIGLLASCIQILFPKKQKTVKYAGNWDPKSKQPWSYRMQKWILSNMHLTKNCKVLVYGKWSRQTKNILPFFTASYAINEIVETPIRKLEGKIKIVFVGGLTKGKQPLKTLKIIHQLITKGYNTKVDFFGDGVEYEHLKKYITQHGLEKYATLHGNASKDTIKRAFREAHFLLFLSKSEGWPKVVAEAMFWACVPLTTDVSCVPYMLDCGSRGSIIKDDASVISAIEEYFDYPEKYNLHAKRAMNWSREFTLEKFESEISKLLKQ